MKVNVKKICARAAYFVAAVVVVAVQKKLPSDLAHHYPNILSLLGILLLAVPALRINDQGRLIARIKPLIDTLDAEKKNLGALDQSNADSQSQKSDLEERKKNLEEIKQKLAGEKGSWTWQVHLCLYAGYGAILCSAIIRLLFASDS